MLRIPAVGLAPTTDEMVMELRGENKAVLCGEKGNYLGREEPLCKKWLKMNEKI
jgi:hypothetical protein